VMAALIGVALLGGPALADALDSPIISPMSAKPSSVRIRVKAGATGAEQGFSAQWIKKADLDALGGAWPEAGSALVRSGDFTGVPVWTTAGNAGDYTMGSLQWMAIELGQLFDESGVAATSTDELEAGTQYVVRVTSRGGNGFDPSAPSANLVVSTLGLSQNCTFTIGYWKTHTGAWPVTNLTLGTVNYTAAEILSILNTPAGGNGLIILAHQLIAAKLNVANGADPTFIAATIASADAAIGSLVVPPVGTDFLAAATTSADAHTLDDWNNGLTGPGHCGETPAANSTWGSLKSLYRK